MKPTKHMLVIRLSAMGDVAMLVPVLRVVVATYPELKITVLTKSFFKPLFTGIPNLDILTPDLKGSHKGVLGLLKLAKQANSLGITHVADTHNVLRSKIIRLALKFRGKKVAAIDKSRAAKKQLIQANGATIKPLKKTHQRYADVFSKLGYSIDLKQHLFPERQLLPKKLEELTKNTSQKFIGIAPFAAHKGKMYPLYLMQEVLEHLTISGTYSIFLFGGGTSEIKQLNTLASSLNNVTSMAGVLNFDEELALISNLDIMLAMDSGNGHLAAMYNIPVITLWGVTHPYAGFVPFNQPNKNQLIADRTQYPKVPTSIYGNTYPKGYEKAIETIPPTLVVEKIMDIL